MTDTGIDLNIDEIQKRIPHRPPMLLIDRITSLIPDQSAVGIKMVSVSDPVFAGHFPDYPIMPGVLIVEAMAQTAAVMVGTSLGLVDGNLNVYFMAIDNCKFRRMVVPGDVLEMKLETTRGKPGGKVWKFKGVATVEGELAAEAEFTAMMDLKS